MNPSKTNKENNINDVEEEIPSIKLVPGPIVGEYDNTDLNTTYNESSAIKIQCSGNTITSSQSVSFNDGILTISSSGTYILSGQLQGQIYIAATENDLIHLILNNLSITSSFGPAIYEVQCKKLIITTIGQNTLTDSVNYPQKEKKKDDSDKKKKEKKNKKGNENINGALNACLLATHDLSLNGQGKLNVTGNYDEGIRSKDNLKLISGTIQVTAKGKGIKAKNSVSIKEATITVDAGDTAIKATEDTKPDKGYVVVDGGHITIKAGNDGIHAETHLTIRNGYINITESVEGLEGQMIDIIGGEVHVKANDDGINASKIGAVNNEPPPPGGFGGPGGPGGPGGFPGGFGGPGGSGGPGGFGGPSAPGASDGSGSFDGSGGPGGFPGGFGGPGGMPPPPPHGKQDPDQDEQVYIRVTGGKLYVSVEGNDVDAIDSNGALYIGGEAEVYVTNGNGDIYGCMAALDADGSNIVDVGSTVVATASGMGRGGPGGPGGPGGFGGPGGPPPFGPGGPRGPGGPGGPPPFGSGGPGGPGGPRGPGGPPPFGSGGPGGPGGFGGPGGPGGAGGPPPFDESGLVKQAHLDLTVDSQKAFTEIMVKDSKGQVIISHKPETVFTKILITSPKLNEGETYTVTIGDIHQEVVASAPDTDTEEKK
eukprot:jgi/Orpsp1_1/1179606/evm.model.c7180000070040.2